MFRQFLAAVTAALIPATASADPTVTAEQLLAYFSPVIDCADDGKCLPMEKGVRRVCIGTVTFCEEAEKVEVEVKTPDPFDLLITFELGSDRLSRQARENLAQFATALKSKTLENATFAIDGHTDARGSEEFNQELSERRAASVVRFLTGLGVSPERLFPQGHGEYLLRVEDDPLAAVNRRVETTIRLPEAGAGRSPIPTD